MYVGPILKFAEKDIKDAAAFVINNNNMQRVADNVAGDLFKTVAMTAEKENLYNSFAKKSSFSPSTILNSLKSAFQTVKNIFLSFAEGFKNIFKKKA